MLPGGAIPWRHSHFAARGTNSQNYSIYRLSYSDYTRVLTFQNLCQGWPSLTAAWALYGVSKGHEVLRGAVDKVALDSLNNVATLCSGACVGMSALAWLSFFSY